ncbi:hypothetical protein Droror1_Dr00006723 [Drosera rotundifolia]
MEEFKGSPYRRRGFDIESVDAGGSGERQDDGDDVFSDSPFDIRSTKNASIERLKRWRVDVDEGEVRRGIFGVD